jgi:hypothetical protein
MFRPISFRRRCFFLLLATGLSVSFSSAQTYAPKYSNEFLSIGVGANAAALGNAVTAFSSDATAAYWNPAGLVGLERRNQVSLMHSEYFAGVAKYDYVGYAAKIDSTRRLGIAIIRFGVDDIPNTLNIQDGSTFNFARITAFSVAELGIIISYAQPMGKIRGVSIGGNLKIINRTAGPFGTAWGFGLDAAVLMQRGRWSLGAILVDATTTFNLWSFNPESFAATFAATGNTIPESSIEVTLPSLRLGVAYTILQNSRLGLRTTGDLVMHFDGQRNVLINSGGWNTEPRMGMEGSFRNRAFLRLGASGGQYLRRIDGSRQFTFNPSAGVGVKLPIGGSLLQIDYALTNTVGVQLGLYTHLLALSFAFDRVAIK